MTLSTISSPSKILKGRSQFISKGKNNCSTEINRRKSPSCNRSDIRKKIKKRKFSLDQRIENKHHLGDYSHHAFVKERKKTIETQSLIFEVPIMENESFLSNNSHSSEIEITQREGLTGGICDKVTETFCLKEIYLLVSDKVQRLGFEIDFDLLEILSQIFKEKTELSLNSIKNAFDLEHEEVTVTKYACFRVLMQCFNLN